MLRGLAVARIRVHIEKRLQVYEEDDLRFLNRGEVRARLCIAERSSVFSLPSAGLHLKKRFPALAAGAYRRAHRKLSAAYWELFVRPRLRRMADTESVFHWHFEKRHWTRSRQSVSGLGSTPAATDHLREAMPKLAASYGVRTMLDIPCGDGNWMSKVNLPLDRYIGADIVDELVEISRSNWGDAANRKFLRLDLTRDALPRVDLIFCRDCLVHFSHDLVHDALRNIKRSGSKYLATTTFPAHELNDDIVTGDWRPLNLQRLPFNLSEPLTMIVEQSASPPFDDKSIGVWRIEDLPG